jgi:hypothetical protein
MPTAAGTDGTGEWTFEIAGTGFTAEFRLAIARDD